MSDQRQAGRTECSFIQWPYQPTQYIEAGLPLCRKSSRRACSGSGPTSLTVRMPVVAGRRQPVYSTCNRCAERVITMSDMKPGIYELLITEALRAELGSVESRFDEKIRPLHVAEAADRIAMHLSRHIQQTLESVEDSERVQVGIEVARGLIARLTQIVESDTSESPVEPGAILHAILKRRPDGTPEPVAEPLIPLLDTTLLTNAPGEPGLLHQIDAEIGVGGGD